MCKTTVANSFDKLQDFFKRPEFTGDGVLFRGVSDATEHHLIPKIARVGMSWRYEEHPNIARKKEQRMFAQFKRWAFPHVKTFAASMDDWDWLALAQHHGLPTRLLDWSRNPWVAVFFAVREPRDKVDAAVFVVPKIAYLHRDELPDDPFRARKVACVMPNHVTPRLTAQFGYFTIHPYPWMALDGPSSGVTVEKVIIPHGACEPILHDLYRYGIHHASLFPDLDHVARHLAFSWWDRTTYLDPKPPQQ